MTEPLPFDDERISAYLDGELSRAELEMFEQLLEQRPDYRQAVGELRTLRTRLQTLPALKLGDDFANRVLRKAETATLIGNDLTGSDESDAPDVTRRSSAGQGWSRNQMIAVIGTLAACLLAMFILPGLMSQQPNIASLPKKSEAAGEIAADFEHDLADEMANDRFDAGTDESASEEIAAEAVRSSPSILSEIAPTPTSSADSSESMADAEFEFRPHGALAEPSAPEAEGAGFAGGRARSELRLISVEHPEFQRLADQARQVLQEMEPNSTLPEDWDLLVATEMRDENDWNSLNTALAANELSLVEPASVVRRSGDRSRKPAANAELDEQDQQHFVIRQNPQLFRQKLQATSKVAVSKTRSKEKMDSPTRSRDRGEGNESADVETHLLYVEGTESQLLQLLESLAHSQSADLVNVLQQSQSRTAHSLRNQENEEWSAPRQKSRRSNRGRAVHLGQSPTKRSAHLSLPEKPEESRLTAPAVQQLRQPQPDRSDEEGEPMLRGLIILQDLSAPINDATTKDDSESL